MPFISQLRSRELKPRLHELTAPLIYRGCKQTFYVPRGFVTDFASTPRLSWLWFPPSDPLYAAPAVIHDWLYETHRTSRKDADGIFLRQMRELGVSSVRRAIIYRTVRLFGGPAYARHGK